MKEWSVCLANVNIFYCQHFNLYELLKFKFSCRLLWQEASPALVRLSYMVCYEFCLWSVGH